MLTPDPGSAPGQLCDLGQVALSLCSSVSSCVTRVDLSLPCLSPQWPGPRTPVEDCAQSCDWRQGWEPGQQSTLVLRWAKVTRGSKDGNF